MKTTCRLSIWAVALILTACSFSKGVKTDLTTGLTTSYNGFGIEEARLVDADGNVLSGSEFEMNTSFSIQIEGIANYALKDGKVFPGLALEVTDSNGNAVLNEADLLSSLTDGASAEDASVLTGTVTVGNPMAPGGKYHCKVRVFDKNNSESEIVSELDFTVK